MSKCSSQPEICLPYVVIPSQTSKTCSPLEKRGPDISIEKARAMKLWKRCTRPRQNPGLTSRICQEHLSSQMIRSTIRTGGGWTMIQLLRLDRPRFRFYFCTQIQIHGCPLENR